MPDSTRDGSVRELRLTPAISVAIWTVPAILSTLETVTFANLNHHPIALWRAFVGEAPQWYCWALFTPAIVFLERERRAAELEIERVRFGDRLRVTIDVPAPLAGARVPIFILQPFVENALKHGILREREGNEISISAVGVDHSLRLVVRDDGRGLPTGDEVSDGVGIRNARERLARMYGNAAQLRVANAHGGKGVAVEIIVPLAS